MMRFFLFIILAGLPLWSAAAQDHAADSLRKTKEDFIILQPEQMPQFKGGEQALMKYLSETIRYPREAMKANVTGIVYVQFVVDATGKVTDPKVIRGIGSGCDEEAWRAVNEMPNWIPGQLDGRNIAVKYTLPIKFSIKNGKAPRQ